MSKSVVIQIGNLYHLDSNRVKQYEYKHVVDTVRVVEQPKKGAKTVLVYSPYLRANVLVFRADLVKLGYDEWFDLYKPQVNHLDPHAGWGDENGGSLYGTGTEELNYVFELSKTNQKRVWTLLEVDGKWYVVAGFHYVNRFGFFVTEKAWENEFEEYFAD